MSERVWQIVARLIGGDKERAVGLCGECKVNAFAEVHLHPVRWMQLRDRRAIEAQMRQECRMR